MHRKIFSILVHCFLVFSVAAQAPGTTQLRDTAHITIGEATITVDHDAMVAKDSALVGKTIPLGSWKVGTVTPAQLTTTQPIRLDDKDVPAGRYSLWILVSADAATLIVNRDSPSAKSKYDRIHDIARIPLTVERGDSTPQRFHTRFLLSPRSAETIVLNYDKSHSQVIDRYALSTELSIRADAVLIFEWQHLRWSVPVRVVRPFVPGGEP